MLGLKRTYLILSHPPHARANKAKSYTRVRAANLSWRTGPAFQPSNLRKSLADIFDLRVLAPLPWRKKSTSDVISTDRQTDNTRLSTPPGHWRNDISKRVALCYKDNRTVKFIRRLKASGWFARTPRSSVYRGACCDCYKTEACTISHRPAQTFQAKLWQHCLTHWVTSDGCFTFPVCGS